MAYCLFQCHLQHMDGIVFVLQLVELIVYFIKYVCAMYELIFAYLLSCSFIFYISWYVIFFYGICSIVWIVFAQILRKWCISPIYRYIIYYCIINCLHILLHTCSVVSWDMFSVSANLFFAVIITSICIHSHGSAKQWWHRSWSIVSYILTSTKISFVKTLWSHDDTDISVILQVMS